MLMLANVVFISKYILKITILITVSHIIDCNVLLVMLKMIFFALF